MNVAGKSLQDIYDAGSKRLEELENAQKQALNDTCETHLTEQAEAEPKSVQRLEERTEELEREIRSFLQRGLERVEKSVNSEVQENERHITRLVEGLSLLSKKFSESIGQLRATAESELTDRSVEAHESFAKTKKLIEHDLNEAASGALDSSQQSGAQAAASICEFIEGQWRTVYDAQSESDRSATDAYHTHVNESTQKAVELRKRLDELVDTQILRLEGQLSQASDNLRNVVENVGEQAERHALDADVRLKEKFSSLLYETGNSFEESASRVTADLIQLCDTSVSDLNTRSGDLTSEMNGLSEEVRNTAAERSQDVQSAGNELLRNYTNELNQRLETSSEFLKEIEGERAEVVSKIWKELTEVKGKFEDKLTNLANDTLRKMRSICEEAENAVSEAQSNCLNDSRNNSANRRDSIEKQTGDFIERINATRQAALDAIARAAGSADSGESDEAADSASSESVHIEAPAVDTDAENKDSAEEDAPEATTQAAPLPPDSEDTADFTLGELGLAASAAEEPDNHTAEGANPRPAENGSNSGDGRKKKKKNSDKRSGDKK